MGAQAAVIRAAIMGGLAVFAGQFGRRQNGLNSLAFVSAVMAVFQPYVLWDVGDDRKSNDANKTVARAEAIQAPDNGT